MTDRDDESAASEDDTGDAQDTARDARPESEPPGRSEDDHGEDEQGERGEEEWNEREQDGRSERREDSDVPLSNLAERVVDDRDDQESDGIDWLDPSTEPSDRPGAGTSATGTSGESVSGENASDGSVNASSDNQEGDDRVSESDEPHAPGELSEFGDPGEDREGAPLERIAGEVRDRRQQREQEVESDLFEEVDVRDIDGEQIWEELLSEEEETDESERAVGAGAEVTEVGTAAGQQRQEHIVPKDEFCGRCPYLGDPPALACEHDGTEIVEVTDADHFRVRDCPFADRDEDDLAEFD